jgi:hypothetical protein
MRLNIAGSLVAALAMTACNTWFTEPHDIVAISPDRGPPAFNLEVDLRSLGESRDDGHGHVSFRQPGDGSLMVLLRVSVRDLQPKTSYLLQRAVDQTLDGICTSTAWLTLGKGAQPQLVTTDPDGTAREDLFRILTGPGSTFDIHFRIVRQDNSAVVLKSECYQFMVK